MASCEERRAAGQARRKQVQRRTHAEWDAKLRHHDPLALLAQSMKGRVPALVPLKYELMCASPFGFFRGAVPIMAADLAVLPNTGIINQISGDAHVGNLGAYAALDGRLVFDINDFDETTLAPFEWDLKRLATSLVLAARDSGDKDGLAQEAVQVFLRCYTHCMRDFAAMPVLKVARYRVQRIMQVGSLSVAVRRKAERATPLRTLQTLTEGPKNQRKFKEERPRLWRVKGEEKRHVLGGLKAYREILLPERRHIFDQYQVRDVCFKVVGTGSVGNRVYCVYMEGNGPGDPLFMQIKEEPGSAYLPYLQPQPKKVHYGRAVADGQRAMQQQSDPFLGWTTIAGRDYLVRQLNDHKAGIDVGALRGNILIAYAELCGELLARGHARSGDVQWIVGYMGAGSVMTKALTTFAMSYANQTEADWEALRKARAPKVTASSKK